jgi:hypothetical protein
MADVLEARFIFCSVEGVLLQTVTRRPTTTGAPSFDLVVKEHYLVPVSLSSVQDLLNTMFARLSAKTLPLALFLATASTANAFVAQRPSNGVRNGVSHQRLPLVSLHLVPDQASQLVAASDAAYCLDDGMEHHYYHAETSTLTAQEIVTVAETPISRAFVARVFSLPSSMIRRHPIPKAKVLPHELEKDVVYFPVVGFQYVRDSPNHCTPLPTVSNPSCRLPIQDEPAYGWFRPEPLANEDAAVPL